jgi:hypothetical protein
MLGKILSNRWNTFKQEGDILHQVREASREKGIWETRSILENHKEPIGGVTTIDAADGEKLFEQAKLHKGIRRPVTAT